MTSHSYDALTTASDFANICGCLEAMMAQVYLAVVIARLVGLQAVPSLPEQANPVAEQTDPTGSE